MSALSSIKQAAAGAIAGVCYWELSRAIGTRKRRPAKSLDWLSRQTPAVVSYSGGLWCAKLPSGETLYCRSKRDLEAALDADEQRKQIGGKHVVSQ